MQTLVIDRKGSRLSLQGRRIRIEVPEHPPRFIPLSMIRRMVVTASTDIQSALLGAIAAEGASVLFLSPRDQRRTAIVLPPHGRDHTLRLMQYRAVTDAGMALTTARTIVRMKLAGQRRSLKAMPVAGVVWRQAYRAFPEILCKLQKANSLNSVRGLEGGAASLYFRAMAESVPDSWCFSGRKRRPPPDPLNALLSLSYTLLHFEAVRVLWSTGLDPCLGFLHAPEYSRESLACDCIEPLRPVVDRFTLNLMHHRILRPDHFGSQQNTCLLGKAGRGIFYAQWEQFMPMPRRSLWRGIQLLKQAIRAQAGPA